MNSYICYTDGSYQDSLKAGGYASIICDENGNVVKELYQGYRNTTNNRMEIMGVLAIFRYFKEPTKLTIISDSMYVVNTINERWIDKWFENKDWEKSNLDLWFEVMDWMDFHDVQMVWTKGHANNELNNRADELCVHAARCLNLPEDEHITYDQKSWESLVSKSRARGPNGNNVG